VVNVVLLLQVINRFHHASTPINHGLARVLLTALVINLAGAAAILWLAVGRRWNNGLSAILKADLVVALLPFVMAALRQGEKDSVFRSFALAYVIFLLCRMLELLVYAGKNADDPGNAVKMPVLIFAATFIVYGGVVPWMSLASGPQGDETHFMILTHSLVFDHDFEVGNNYKNHDYLEEFPPPSPGQMRGYPFAFIQRDGLAYLPHEPHVVRNFRGQLMLEHDIGFPLLLVPGYALDKREGALFTEAVIGAAGAAGIYEAAILLGAESLYALLAVGLFCFTGPYWVFSQSALLDLPCAVANLWIGLQFLRYRRRERNRYLLLAGVLIAILPWLNVRFWPLAGPSFLVLSAWIFYRNWGNWPAIVRGMAYLGIPNLVGLGTMSLIDKHLFNTYMPNAGMLTFNRLNPGVFGYSHVHAFLGLMFDQSFGLIPLAPLYVAVAAGMVVLFRRDRWAFAALVAPAVGYLPFVTNTPFWSGGWCAPGRYLLALAVLMVPSVALVLNRKVRWIVAIFAAWSVSISILFTVNPYLRMPSVWDLYQMSMLVEFFHDHIRTQVYSIMSIYPNMMQARTRDYVRGFFWLVVFIAGAWAWSRTVKETPPSPSRYSA
jgi:hypothetical protein